jgi:hypothetical protein
MSASNQIHAIVDFKNGRVFHPYQVARSIFACQRSFILVSTKNIRNKTGVFKIVRGKILKTGRFFRRRSGYEEDPINSPLCGAGGSN